MVEKSTMVFIEETKWFEDNFKSIAKKIWKKSDSIVTDSFGVAGGLGILWNPLEISLTNFMATKLSISVEFHILGTSSKGILTNVYGPFILAPKQAFLNSLRAMSHFVGHKH